jgi:hypothetical protein
MNTAPCVSKCLTFVLIMLMITSMLSCRFVPVALGDLLQARQPSSMLRRRWKLACRTAGFGISGVRAAEGSGEHKYVLLDCLLTTVYRLGCRASTTLGNLALARAQCASSPSSCGLAGEAGVEGKSTSLRPLAGSETAIEHLARGEQGVKVARDSS